MGIICIGLLLCYCVFVVIVWLMLGVVMLVVGVGVVGYSDVIGVFVLVVVLGMIVGFLGIFVWLM